MNCILWIYGSPEFCSSMASKLAELNVLSQACILESSRPNAFKSLKGPAVPKYIRPSAFWKIPGFKSKINALLKQYPKLPVLFLAETKNKDLKAISFRELRNRKLIQISPEPRWPLGFHLAWSDPDAFLPTWELALHWIDQKVIWP